MVFVALLSLEDRKATKSARSGPVTTPEPLLPEPDEVSAPFWRGCAEGELRVQACAACGRRRFPPRHLCPHCRSPEVRWDPLSGRGTIWSWVVAHPPLLPAYADQAPYNVVVVTLDEDPSLRLVGNVVEAPDDRLDAVDPATLAIGQPVEVVFAPAGEEMALPRWRLSEG
jgi:uncharacterized OB-fold protein